MQPFSIAAIFFLFWVMSAFIMLPFGVRTLADLEAEEAGEHKVAGQADSAPVNFRPGKLMLRATVIAAVLTALFVANWEHGWITLADLDVLPKPPGQR
jgi:predicted secreted protein